MTEQELRIWLGLDEGFTLRQELIDAMANTPVPTSDLSQLAAFQTFLAWAGKPVKPMFDQAIHGDQTNIRGWREWSVKPTPLATFRKPRELREDTYKVVPWKSRLVSFILIRGDRIVFEKDPDEKFALVFNWMPGDTLLMAWPGQYSQDIFILNEQAREAAKEGLR